MVAYERQDSQFDCGFGIGGQRLAASSQEPARWCGICNSAPKSADLKSARTRVWDYKSIGFCKKHLGHVELAALVGVHAYPDALESAFQYVRPVSFAVHQGDMPTVHVNY